MINNGLLLTIFFTVTFSNPIVTKPTEQLLAFEGNESAPQYKEVNSTVPTIYQMDIKSRINNRFATTVVTNKVINTANKTQKAAFSVILPKDALVSAFDMEIDESYYKSYVVDNEEARSQYNSALADGLEVRKALPSDLGSNIFQIFVNMNPNSKATFYLTYEELMKRNEKGYEQIINIHPGQLVEEVNVELFISESRKIKNLKIASLRPIKKTPNVTYDFDPEVYIGEIDDSSVVVKFSANKEKQKQLALLLKSDDYNGLSAQFVVQYDIEHDMEGEVLIRDCYFAHYFTQPSLPKHVVLLVQSAVSMAEQDKLRQQKLVAQNILDQLNDQDVFTLLEYCGAQKVWDLDNPEASTYHYLRNEPNVTFTKPFPANEKYIMQAKQIISSMKPNGYSDILTALETSLKLIEMERHSHTYDDHRQALIVILTDGKRYGYHTAPQTSESIIEKITSLNSSLRKPSISSILLFGSEENEKFLQSLTLLNMGVYKHINEASDTVSNKLQNFFGNEVFRTELVNITFDYNSSELKDITDFNFPVLGNESEIVVVGQCGFGKVIHTPRIIANRRQEVVEMRPLIQKSQSDISRLWAYVTVKQLLEKKKNSKNNIEEINKKILEVSLKYSFVTDVTSMVVVKPNEKVVVGNEELSGTTESHLSGTTQANMES